MAGPKTIARLRRTLLALLFLLVIGLAGLYWLGRIGRPSVEPPLPRDVTAETPEEEVVLAAEDFDFSLEEEGNTLFRVQADQYEERTDGSVRLRSMILEARAQDGGLYRLSAQRAIFDQETLDAELIGGVEVRGPDGFQANTEALTVKGNGKLLEGRQPVTLLYGKTARGGGQQMRVNLDTKFYLLAGAVWLESLPGAESPFAMTAERVLYEKGRSMARADGGATLRYQEHCLAANRITLRLDEVTQEPVFVRGLWQVSGDLVPATEGESDQAPVSFEARKFSINLDPETGDPTRFELEGGVFNPVVVTTEAPEGGLRTLTTNYLTGLFTDGELSSGETFGRVVFEETAPGAPPGQPLRKVTAERAEATFRDGRQIQDLRLSDWVVYEGPEFSVRGQRATLDLETGKGEYFGEPVELRSADGDLSAPHVLYTRTGGILRADGGTRTQLRQSADPAALRGTPLGSGDGPIWVEAKEAFLKPEGGSFRFAGEVRAWRGEDLILSDELLGDEARQELIAKGSVRTLSHPRQQPGESDDPARPTGPLEVTADEMEYRGDRSEILYRGAVKALQDQRLLSCEALTGLLDESSEIETLLCVGETELRDPVSGRTIKGDEALYRVAAGSVRFTGGPVTLTEATGGTISGPELIYEIESGRARMVAPSDPEAGEGTAETDGTTPETSDRGASGGRR